MSLQARAPVLEGDDEAGSPRQLREQSSWRATSDEEQDKDRIKGHAALGINVREKAQVPPARSSLRATEIWKDHN